MTRSALLLAGTARRGSARSLIAALGSPASSTESFLYGTTRQLLDVNVDPGRRLLLGQRPRS